jgi:hypothetical protein
MSIPEGLSAETDPSFLQGGSIIPKDVSPAILEQIYRAGGNLQPIANGQMQLSYQGGVEDTRKARDELVPPTSESDNSAV